MPPLTCDVSAKCGGCPLLGLSRDDAKTRKLEDLRATLSPHLGDVAFGIPIRWVGGNAETGYRHRLRLKVDPLGQIQFFNAQKSPNCAVLEPSLTTALAELLKFNQSHASDFTDVCHLELRAPDLDQRAGLMLTLHPSCATAPTRLLDRLSQLPQNWIVSVTPSEHPPRRQRHALVDLYHYVPLTSFLQVNRAMNDQLVKDVLLQAKALNIRTFCDLYAGAGNFTLPLLKLGARGVAIEYEAHAMDACRSSALSQALTGGTFIRGDSLAASQRLIDEGTKFDLVVVDPPRAGAKDLVPHLHQLATRAIAYLSCNPASLGRDLKSLISTGFSIESVTAYEMFEHTRHLETCVWLRASGRNTPEID